MDDPKLDELKLRKKTFIALFIANWAVNFSIFGTAFILGGQSPFSTLLWIISFGVAVWFIGATFRFARALYYETWSSILHVFAYLFPLTMIISMYMLLKEYKRQAGVEYTFLMFDKD